MLATSTDEPFDDPEWVFEPLWDGVRVIALCGEETRLVSGKGDDITVAYPELHAINRQVVALDAMLDGEIVAFEDGLPSLERLQQRMNVHDKRRTSSLAKTNPVVFIVFDVVFVDGRDLTGQPLHERRHLLEEAVVPGEKIQLSPVTEGHGVALY
jgi:bifunctional non-homologous end joining protein LigD